MILRKLSHVEIKSLLLYIFLLCMIIFALLVFKNPYSERTLIPNLEPFPDTIYYLTPSINFLKGEGFVLEGKNNKVILPHVPILYSIILTPVFVLSKDPRSFYFVNVILSFLSLTLFFIVSKKLTKSKLVISVTLILFITNFYIYSFPSLAMSENLLLLIFLMSIWILTRPLNLNNILISACLAPAFYFTKYAATPLFIIYSLMYLSKIILDSGKRKAINIIIFLSSLLIISISIFFIDYLTTKNSIYISILQLITNLVNVPDRTIISQSNLPMFSFSYLVSHVSIYAKSLIGQPINVLWWNNPLLDIASSIMGILGLLVGTLFSKYRLLFEYLVLSLISQILFMSFFYTIDGRYIYFAIPILLLGVIALLNQVTKLRLIHIDGRVVAKAYIILFLILYFIFNENTLKNQIMLNLRHQETPWDYEAVLALNNYFAPITGEKKPIVISPLPPFYINYFSNSHYGLLPLSQDQEFRNYKSIIWGEHNYSNLPSLYANYLRQGFKLYVAPYGVGAQKYPSPEFNDLKNNFNLTKVADGCYGSCNIYSLTLRSDTER